MDILNIPTKEEVNKQNQDIFDNLNKALGFVPNLYAVMAHSDTGLKKYLDFQNTKTSFSNKEKEIINLVVSQVNTCMYCLSAHTLIGKMNGFSEEEVLEIRKGNSTDTKFQALIDLTKDLTENRGRAQESTTESFFSAGYSKENLVDLVLQISDKTAMNYLHNLTKIEIDFPEAKAL
ncbi:MAG: carboxymuconolactone decarboxylase family protein [Flavobacteriales bacterium]